MFIFLINIGFNIQRNMKNPNYNIAHCGGLLLQAG